MLIGSCKKLKFRALVSTSSKRPIFGFFFFFFRFDDLKELFANRQSQLEDSLGLHQFFYDLEMEMAWIREHMTLATSEDLGTSLIGVQRLQKRHLVRIYWEIMCPSRWLLVILESGRFSRKKKW